MHTMPCALFFAPANAGSNIAAKMAMMAITTNSSIRVNARDRDRFLNWTPCLPAS
jgi:hypothetical protein